MLRNPFLFLLLIVIAGGTYIAHTLNLLGPMMQMAAAASQQAVDIGKERLREFLENSETAREALSLPEKDRNATRSGTGDMIRLDPMGQQVQRSDRSVQEHGI